MRRNGDRITELGGLLDALCIRRIGSNKTSAEVKVYPEKGLCEVTEYFDDGKGHSGAFTSRTCTVDVPVFEEALHLEYITGKLKPGYVSKTEFVLTTNSFLLDRIYDLADEWSEKEWFRQRGGHGPLQGSDHEAEAPSGE